MTTVIYIDISDFVRTRSHTGIQRVVIEYLLRAHSSAPHIDYRVVFFNPSHNKFNRISVEELKAFLHNPKTYTFRNVTIVDVDALPKGTLTIFFDIDSIWNSLVQRPVLYPKIKEQNIYIFNFIYDLIPCIKPNFAHENTVRKYLLFLSAVYAYSDLVFFDSRSAEKDFYQIKKEIQVDRYISTRVVPLGSDYSTSPETTSSRKIKRILQEKYILFVGTIEPRKKQDLALDSFETLNQRYPEMHLVFVGKKGWNVEQTTQRIANHPLRDSRFIWLDSIDDYQLSQLYKNAFLVMYLSEYEG
ncbi:MAG: glycosyltransferase family 4 protein, partial [Desulfobacteraceae bacterium]|nr:glycosyltransferase family 4 protein [Desulfobacteraceae bacterium]